MTSKKYKNAIFSVIDNYIYVLAFTETNDFPKVEWAYYSLRTVSSITWRLSRNRNEPYSTFHKRNRKPKIFLHYLCSYYIFNRFRAFITRLWCFGFKTRFHVLNYISGSWMNIILDSISSITFTSELLMKEIR